MQKDLKIGLAVGLGLVAGAVIWVATRPSMSPEARMPQRQETGTIEPTGPAEEPNSQTAGGSLKAEGFGDGHPQAALEAATLPAPPQTPPVETPVQEAVAAVEQPTEEVFDSTVHEQTEKIETQRFYIVRRGDTLSKISVTYYGSANQWRKIFEANRETIANPDKLTPGQKLIIPD